MTDQLWSEALKELHGQMTQATYDQWFAGSQLERVNGYHVVHATSSQAKENLEGHWVNRITMAVSRAAGQDVVIKFDAQGYYYPETKPEPARTSKADLDVQGVYLDKRNAIIQPKKMHAETLYFMREWWPLLKPVESLLIMVLRQRCYYKPGNTCQATYAELAKAINVSTKTLKRTLERDQAGQFKNEYLGQFIKAIETIRTKNKDNHVRNAGSKFVVVLDDPLTPDDTAKLAKKL